MMEQRTPPPAKVSLSRTLSSKKKITCEILYNLSMLLKISKLRVSFPVWGAKKTRLPRKRPRKQKNVRWSLATTLGFSTSDSDVKGNHYVGIKVHKEKTEEELSKTLKELIQVKEILTKEIEKVKTCHKERKAYNAVLKAKQEEIQLKGREINSKGSASLNLEMKLSKSLNLETELNKSIKLFPLSVENHHTYHPHYSAPIQHNYTLHYPCRPSPPSLDIPLNEVENSQHTLDYNVQSHGDGDRQRATRV